MSGWWLVRRSDNGVGHINREKLRRTPLVLTLMTTFGRSIVPLFYRPLRPTQPDRPSVGIGAMSTGDGFGHHWGRNGELCVAVGHVTGTAGILDYGMLA